MCEPLFEQAYARWLHARAEVADFDVDSKTLVDEDCDKRCYAALEALQKAEWQFIEVPAFRLMDIKQRAEFVRQVFDTADNSGAPTDNRHRVALSRLITEILRYSEAAEEAVPS